jgi:hypothetical protein
MEKHLIRKPIRTEGRFSSDNAVSIPDTSLNVIEPTSTRTNRQREEKPID